MSVIEIDHLLQEISPEAPSGENDLAHDPAFMELEKDIRGTPAVEVGDKVIQEAKEPDWSKIQESALALLARTHDLRVAVSLTRALLHIKGLEGLHDGLSLLCGYVERYWDTLYPRLDPEDDNDPIERVSVLETLSDWNMVIAPLMKLTLCSSRTAGNINLRQYRIATGKLDQLTVSEDERKSAPSLATIEGVFKALFEASEKGDKDAPEALLALEALAAKKEIVGASLDTLEALETVLKEKAGTTNVPDLIRLEQILKEMYLFFEEHLSGRESFMPSPSDEEGPDSVTVSSGARRSPRRFGAVSEWMASLRRVVAESPKETEASDVSARAQAERLIAFAGGGKTVMVQDRKDVLYLLGQICNYYEHFEPASPVPLLLKRTMRLVEKNFMEIIEDLAPDSVSQIERICGSKESKE